VVTGLSRYRELMLFGRRAGVPQGAGLGNGRTPMAAPVVGGTRHPSRARGSASVTINQSSQNAIINWATFNIFKNETTDLQSAEQQPRLRSIALIGGQGPSFLDGTPDGEWPRVHHQRRRAILFGSSFGDQHGAGPSPRHHQRHPQ